MKKTATALIGAALLAASLAGCASQIQTDLSAADTAENTAGQADLSMAAIAASGYLGENGSFDGFNAAAASAMEPAFKWVDGGPATLGVISIRGAGGDSVVMVTMSASGTPQCLAFSGGAQSLGSTDATTAAGCTGG